MAVVNLIDSQPEFGGLTEHRPLATIPFGGRYRLMDFVLSGIVNSGITNVGILAPPQQRSLLDHIRSGRDWQLERKRDGLMMLLPPYQQEGQPVGGDLDNFIANLDYFKKSRQEHVLVTAGNLVGNFDFLEPLQIHTQSGADITMLYQTQAAALQDCPNCRLLELDGDNRVKAISENPGVIEGSQANFFLGTFILKKNLLLKLIKECAAGCKQDSLLQGMAKRLMAYRVQAAAYNGYLARIHCLESYYRHSLELLNPDIWQALFGKNTRIYTKISDEAPARYSEDARVIRTMVAGGCVIRGTVEGSILFPRVAIGRGSVVKDSILMFDTYLEDAVLLENVICDKDVRITRGRQLRGDAGHPLVLKKGTVV